MAGILELERALRLVARLDFETASRQRADELDCDETGLAGRRAVFIDVGVVADPPDVFEILGVDRVAGHDFGRVGARRRRRCR